MRHLTKITSCIFAAVSLSGCISIGARVLEAAVAEPRTKRHAYYLEVDLSFRANGKQVRATRYAEVFYRSGEATQLYREACDVTNVRCWFVTERFFVGLPNGDIVNIALPVQGQILMTMNIDQTIHPAAKLVGIYRDQPGHPDAEMNGPCMLLSKERLATEYGLQGAGFRDLEPQMDLTVGITRVAGIARNSVFDPEEFSHPRIFDHATCRQLIGRTTALVTIEP